MEGANEVRWDKKMSDGAKDVSEGAPYATGDFEGGVAEGWVVDW